MKKGRFFSLLALAAVSGAVVFMAAGDRPVRELADTIADATHSRTTLSEIYTVDREYRSMMGPSSTQGIRLLESEKPELLWITGYEAVMVGPDGESPRGQELMCHSNLDIDVERHQQLLGPSRSFSTRLFTLSQGQFQVRFPPGFGIPIASTESLDLSTQVLNLNHRGQTTEVRHKVRIEYVRDREIEAPMQALFPTAGYGLALLGGDDGYYGVSDPDGEIHGPGCLVGASASAHQYDDGLGREFTGHWVVPPGRQVNRTLVTQLMRVPYDTTIHYIAVHLHPFAESLELRDLTTEKTVFKSRARGFDDRIGLAHVDHLASTEGIEVFADHEYEMVSVYDNTSEEDQDSMAVMYMYLRDRQFDQRRVAKALAAHAG
ncbi:MAG: hypothetical protein GY719_02685 [bacterium]|nr:hypothetical protein [bacterium]